MTYTCLKLDKVSQWVHSFVRDLIGVNQVGTYWPVFIWWTCLCTRRYTRTELNPQHCVGSECGQNGRWEPFMSAPDFTVKVWQLSRYFIRCKVCGSGADDEGELSVDSACQCNISWPFIRVINGIYRCWTKCYTSRASSSRTYWTWHQTGLVHVCSMCMFVSFGPKLRKTFSVWPSTCENILAELLGLFEVCCVSSTKCPHDVKPCGPHRGTETCTCVFDEVWRGRLESEKMI